MSASSDINQCWSVLSVRKDSILELRALWPNGITGVRHKPVVKHFHSKDFASAAKLKAAFESAATQLNESGYNVYSPFNRIAHVAPGTAAKDSDIAKVDYVLIDIDRTSDTKRPATSEEVANAAALAKDIRAFLGDNGFPNPIEMMSGNGTHMLYPLDTEDVDLAKSVIKEFLYFIAGNFDNDRVCVDKGVHNPSRIWKLPGSYARKGEQTPDRPYRKATITQGVKPSPISLEMLKKVTELESEASVEKSQPPACRELAKGETQVQRLKSALAHISSDVPRGNGKILDKHGVDDGYWAGVVWAIAGLGWPDGKDIARSWSMQSERYSDEGFEDVWHAYNPNHAKPIGIGSVFDLAKKFGWSLSPFEAIPENNDTSSASVKGTRYRLSNRNDLMAMPPLEWVVKGVLPSRGLAAVFGPSGSGKTFLLLNLAAAICSGDPWFGFRTRQTPVVYLGLEGGAGLQKRVKAWELANNTEFPSNFRYLISDFELSNSNDVDGLIEVLPANSVCIVDTLNRASPGSDENSSADMGKLLAAAKKIEAQTCGLVILCHHTGKDPKQGLRGHSSLHAAMDAEIELIRDKQKDTRSWRSSKLKDEKDGDSYGFRLLGHYLGFDEDGDAITSCTVESEITVQEKRLPKGKLNRPAYYTIKALISESTIRGVGTVPCEYRCIRVDDAIAVVREQLVTTQSNRRTTKAKGILDSLIAEGFFKSGLDPTNDEGWIWAPEE